MILFGLPLKANYPRTFLISLSGISITHSTRKIFTLWNLSKTSDCSFCLQPESLLHVVAGCKTCLNESRFTWGHDSVLDFLASSLHCLNHCTFCADLPQYLSPSLITGDDLRPDILISTSNTLYVVELSVCFETNLSNNAIRKFEKYRYLLHDLESKYHHVKFVHMSISSIGIFRQSCNSFIQMCTDLSINTGHTTYIFTNLTSIIIRSKPWINPDLLSY